MLEQFYKDIFLGCSGVSTDTRKIKKGNLFIALCGENYNGNEYIDEALSKGAIHAVSDDLNFKSHENVTVVENGLKFLQDLATHHRITLKTPIISLTGSNGKTTTKEIIISILETQFKVTGTKGNFNNHIGVPLTLLSFTKETEIGVVEMGANHMKEIELLSEIARPDYGLITNYGKAHLEGFGSEENIKIGKSELYEHLIKHNKKAIVGSWDQEQIKRSKNVSRIFTTNHCTLVTSEPFITLTYKKSICSTSLTGAYNYQNILLATTVGEEFNISKENIIKGIENYIPENNRSQIVHKNGLTIILDAYNANPNSMEVALKNLALQKENPKTAILGDMFELGVYSKEEHLKIAKLSNELGIDKTFLIGEHFSQIKSNQYETFESFENFAKHHTEMNSLKGVLLIKGSRGMALERVMDLF